jgi:hypothetical protein
MRNDEFDGVDNAELRNAVNAFLNLAPKPQQPDAPGCAGLSDKARDTAATLYLESIMAKDAGKLTPAERDFLRASIKASGF